MGILRSHSKRRYQQLQTLFFVSSYRFVSRFGGISSSSSGGGLAQWLPPRTTDRGVPGSRHVRVAVRCGLEKVTLPPLLSTG